METIQYTSPFFRADHVSYRVIHRAPDTTQTKEPMTSHQTENNAPNNTTPAAGHRPHGPHGASEDP